MYSTLDQLWLFLKSFINKVELRWYDTKHIVIFVCLFLSQVTHMASKQAEH